MVVNGILFGVSSTHRVITNNSAANDDVTSEVCENGYVIKVLNELSLHTEGRYCYRKL